MSGTKKNRGGLAQALQQQQYNLIFSDGPNQQEITEEALGICKKLAIDPNTIKLKQIQEFEEAGVSETVLKVRFKHYQEKRKNNLETIEKTIRINRGMVLPMGNMNYGFNNRDEISSPGIKLNSSALNTLTRTAKSANRLAGNSSMIVNDHRKASNGFRLNLVDNRNTSYNLFNSENQYGKSSSFMGSQPDIPLREPLDFEFRLNRKMAKKIYEQEKMQKVLDNKSKAKEDYQTSLKNLVQSYEQREKQFVKEKRGMQEFQQHKLQQVKQRREQILEKKQRMMQLKEQELRHKEEKLQEEYSMFQRRKEERAKMMQEEMFVIDIEREREKKDKTGRTMMQKMREQEEIQQRLTNFEQKLKRHEDLKTQELQKVQERMHDFNAKVFESSKIIQSKEEQERELMNQAKRTFNRLIKSEKFKQDMQEHRIYSIKEKNQKRLEQASQKQSELSQKDKEKYTYLERRNKQRDDLIEEFYEAFKEDIEQKKELSFLKKIDQMENLQRTKNFYNMYRSKLIEKLQDKMMRADQVKYNKEFIKEMYYTNGNQINKTQFHDSLVRTKRDNNTFNNSMIQ
eukprot:403376923